MTGSAPGRVLPPAPDPDESKWGYRQSLASRVVLLTTFAVALAVAFVAAGAFLTVKMQLQSSLDAQLLERAETASSQIDQIATQLEGAPAFLVGVSDVRVACVQRGRRRRVHRPAARRSRSADPSSTSLAGTSDAEHPHRRTSTARRTASSPSPPTAGPATRW